MLADEPVIVASAAQAYRILREEGIAMQNSTTPPKPDKFALWRRRVNDLVSMTDPKDEKKDFLHADLQAALLKVEDGILIKHPQLQ